MHARNMVVKEKDMMRLARTYLRVTWVMYRYRAMVSSEHGPSGPDGGCEYGTFRVNSEGWSLAVIHP